MRCAALMLLALASSPCLAQTPGPGGAPPALTDGPALESFVDGLMQAHMEDKGMTSAVVAIVKDGVLLFSKGYGYADLDRGIPVDPQRSLFRIGSISKLFTWTAVMQLAEQGKLDLDVDINRYLHGIHIPASYPQPVTLRHLLTHTAGFEESGYGAKDPGIHQSILETMRLHMPARVRPPGILTAYSNYGAALAGLIVEQVSGVPFNEYLQRNLFTPLDMRASFQEPLPERLRPWIVKGYAREHGDLVEKPYEAIGGMRPAGSMAVSAADISHFMLAHLQQGEYLGRRILKPETWAAMHQSAFQLDPRFPGMELGFYRRQINGRLVTGHGGAIPPFHSDLALVPDLHLGIFTSNANVTGTRIPITAAIIEHYFPAAPGTTREPGAEKAAGNYAGSYFSTRRVYTRFEKIFDLIGGPPAVKVTELPGRRLLITALPGIPEAQFVPLGENAFRQSHGNRTLLFRKDESGRATHLFIDGVPYLSMERLRWHEHPMPWRVVAVVCVLLLLTHLVQGIRQRSAIRQLAPRQRQALRLSMAASLCALIYFMMFSLAVLLGLFKVPGATMGINIPLLMKGALLLPLAFVALVPAIVAHAIQAGRRDGWSRAWRIHYGVAAAATVLLASFFWQWNQLGWRFDWQ